MKRTSILIPVFVAVMIFVSGCASQQPNAEKKDTAKTLPQQAASDNAAVKNESKPAQPTGNVSNENLSGKYRYAVIKTNYGDIKVKFYNEDSPKTVENFLKLAQSGFYDGTKFHRVIFDFMIQGGDPKSKDNDWSDDGTGDPGYKFADEFNNHKLVRGSLAMANSGPNTNGSQFFIVTKSATPWLDGKHTNFGELVEGYDTVMKIEALKVDANAHPLEDAVIKNIELLEK